MPGINRCGSRCGWGQVGGGHYLWAGDGWGLACEQAQGRSARGPKGTPSPLPLLPPGRRDSSGIRLYYTAKLRRYDAGIMELGLVYTPVMAIPPQESAYTLTGYCTDKCTQLVSGAGPKPGPPRLRFPAPGSQGRAALADSPTLGPHRGSLCTQRRLPVAPVPPLRQ